MEVSIPRPILSMEISVPHPIFSMKIKASPTPFMSESGTAFFSISLSYIHHYISDGRIPILQPYGPSESMSFRFDQLHGGLHLLAVADKISSLTGVYDPVFFERFPCRIFVFCTQAISRYRDRGVEFSVSVVMCGSAAPPVQGASYIDEVLVSDSDVLQGGGGTRRRQTRQRQTRRRQTCVNRAIEKLERIKDVTVASGQCAICLEEFCRGNDLEIGRTPCSHMFHYRCVEKWLERRQTCPICRSDICS